MVFPLGSESFRGGLPLTRKRRGNDALGLGTVLEPE
jgi:hypothetical protein